MPSTEAKLLPSMALDSNLRFYRNMLPWIYIIRRPTKELQKEIKKVYIQMGGYYECGIARSD
jgi:hypothetical protein